MYVRATHEFFLEATTNTRTLTNTEPIETAGARLHHPLQQVAKHSRRKLASSQRLCACLSPADATSKCPPVETVPGVLLNGGRWKFCDLDPILAGVVRAVSLTTLERRGGSRSTSLG